MKVYEIYTPQRKTNMTMEKPTMKEDVQMYISH